jgi:hypothetical protein
MINNPFDITKAVDYTDEEILKFWVDFDGNGFRNIMKPDSAMPIIIKGSKGSGKTHIMKYYSYELQKIRSASEKKSLAEYLNQDRFVGVYIRCSGFNAEQFEGKGVPDEMWKMLYAYFWELWVGERIVTLLMDLQRNGVIGNENEGKFVEEALSLFLRQIECDETLEALRNLFLDLQKEILYEIQNFIFENKDKPQVNILLAPNSITYGMPNLLTKEIPFFHNKRIMYLVDELENFSESQQELIQLLLREKPISCTFRIGTRPYGIRTYKILGGEEENHEGSEFELVSLDEELRNNKRYHEYVAEICKKRIKHAGFDMPESFALEELIENQTTEDIFKLVYNKKESQSRTYINKLQSNLKKYINKYKIQECDADVLVERLYFEEDRIIERTNVFLMYQCLKDRKKNLLQEIDAICTSARKYKETKDNQTEHWGYLDKHKQDVIDTIAREGNVAIPYNGLKRLIDLSCGTPRTILRMLKTAFNKQYFNTGLIPFEGNRKLTVKAQNEAIEETSDWFFEENRIPSVSEHRPLDAARRIGNYLQSIRFTDLPPQCSINIFSIDVTELSEEARDVFETLVKYSYIIQTSRRREKNTDNRGCTYQLNTILLPKWELALAKRGQVDISKTEAEVLLLNKSTSLNFDELMREKLRQYNYPFGKQESEQQMLPFKF